MFALFDKLVENKAVLFTTDSYYEDRPICGKFGEAYSTVNFGPGTCNINRSIVNK